MSKVFVVTGASRGIGLAIAKYLLGASHNVVLAAQSKEPLEALKNSYPKQVEYLAGDLSNFDTASQVAGLATKTFGRIDGIVVNHGVLSPIERLADASLEEWRKHYDVNVFSGLALVKAAIPELRKSKGCVLWVSTSAPAFTAWSAYGSAKAAINHISAHLAVEEHDITSVAVTPGIVDTGMQKVIRDSGKDTMASGDHAFFKTAFEEGKLVKPEQPGHVMARFVVKPDPSLSGKLLEWQASELAAYQDDA